jgi:hypothetical protein
LARFSRPNPTEIVFVAIISFTTRDFRGQSMRRTRARMPATASEAPEEAIRLLADYSLAARRRQLTTEPLGAKLFNLALETFDLLERISGGREFVGALIWLNGSAECAVVNFADGCSSLDLGPDLGPQNHFSLGSYWAVRQSHGVLLSLVATVDDVEFRHELTPSQSSYAHPEFSTRPPPARGSLWSALSGCVVFLA